MNTLDVSRWEAYPVPPEQVPPAPRRIALARRGRLIRAGLIAAILVAPNLILVLGYNSNQSLRDLVDHGRSITATILNRRIERRGRSGVFYLVRCRYAVEGRAFTKEESVPKPEYDLLPPGAECQVCYLPDQPATCCLGRPATRLRRSSESILLFAGLAAAGLAFMLVYCEVQFHRELTLARDGEPLLGNITDRGSTTAKNRTRYWARYCFMTAGGEQRTSWHYVPLYIWDCLLLGVPVTVLVDPVNSRRHCPLYAFRYVRILEEAPADEMLHSSG